MKVEAIATRSEGWWSVEVPAIDGLYTQARRLDQVADLVRDAAELLDGIPPAELEVDVRVDTEHADKAEGARVLAEEAQRLQEKASEAMRDAARTMARDGLPVRDIGDLLGVSFQRAQKLAASGTPARKSSAPIRGVRIAHALRVPPAGQKVHIVKSADLPTPSAVDVIATPWSGAWKLWLDGHDIGAAYSLDNATSAVREHLDQEEPGVDHQGVDVRVVTSTGR